MRRGRERRVTIEAQAHAGEAGNAGIAASPVKLFEVSSTFFKRVRQQEIWNATGLTYVCGFQLSRYNCLHKRLFSYHGICVVGSGLLPRWATLMLEREWTSMCMWEMEWATFELFSNIRGNLQALQGKPILEPILLERYCGLALEWDHMPGLSVSMGCNDGLTYDQGGKNPSSIAVTWPGSLFCVRGEKKRENAKQRLI